MEIGDLKSARWQILRVKNVFSGATSELSNQKLKVWELAICGVHTPPTTFPRGVGGPGVVTGEPCTSYTPISGRFVEIQKFKDREG